MWKEVDEATVFGFFGDLLEKAISHKYIKRVPYTDSKGKRRYRYFYPSKGHRHDEDHHVDSTHVHSVNVEEGASFALGKDKGHLLVLGKTPDGKFRVVNDDVDGKGTRGKEEHLTAKQVRQKIRAAHMQQAILHAEAGLARLQDIMDRAEKHGTERHQARAKESLAAYREKHTDYLQPEPEDLPEPEPEKTWNFVYGGQPPWSAQKAPKGGRGEKIDLSVPTEGYSKKVKEYAKDYDAGVEYARNSFNTRRIKRDPHFKNVLDMTANTGFTDFRAILEGIEVEANPPAVRLALQVKKRVKQIDWDSWTADMMGLSPEKKKPDGYLDGLKAVSEHLVDKYHEPTDPEQKAKVAAEVTAYRGELTDLAIKKWEGLTGRNYEDELAKHKAKVKKKKKKKKSDAWTYEELPDPKYPPEGLTDPKTDHTVKRPDHFATKEQRIDYYQKKLGNHHATGKVGGFFGMGGIGKVLFSDLRVKNREEIARDPDGWKMHYYSRGLDPEEEGTKKKPTFVGRYGKDIQELWDNYGLVLEAPKKHKKIHAGVLERVKEELAHLNECFPVRETIAKYGLALSVDPKYKPSLSSLLMGQYNQANRKIRLCMGVGTTFIHELFHAMDQHAGGGSPLTGKYDHPVAHLASSAPLEELDPEFTYKHKKYLKQKDEKLARLMQQFSSYVFPAEVDSIHYKLTPKKGYWEHDYMKDNADLIAGTASILGIDFRPEFVERVKKQAGEMAKTVIKAFGAVVQVVQRTGARVLHKATGHILG